MNAPVKLTIVVNGVKVEMAFQAAAPLSHVRDVALLEALESHRPVEDWELRDVDGMLLEYRAAVASVAMRQPLFLTLPTGVGA